MLDNTENKRPSQCVLLNIEDPDNSDHIWVVGTTVGNVPASLSESDVMFHSDRISDAPTIEALQKVVGVQMDYYNDVRRPSALAKQPPGQWLARWLVAAKETPLPTELSLRSTPKPEK